MSASIAKFIRRTNSDRQNKLASFILVSANTDIIEYLQPSLLITLGTHNGGIDSNDSDMRIIRNPHIESEQSCEADVKVVINPTKLTRLKIADIPDFRYDNGSDSLSFSGLHIEQSSSFRTVHDSNKKYIGMVLDDAFLGWHVCTFCFVCVQNVFVN